MTEEEEVLYKQFKQTKILISGTYNSFSHF